MNLVIDVGNSTVKLAVFDGFKLMSITKESKTRLVSTVKSLIKKFKVSHAIISKVGHLSPKTIDKISHLTNLIILNKDTALPFQNCYKTPETLGADRIALAAAAVLHYAHHNILAIDAGTCITYDFVNENHQYLGGAISPGLNMRYKAMHTFTEKLPLLKPSSTNMIIGGTTLESMHTGAFVGILNEIDGFISAYKNIYPNLTVILTGGDAKILANQLKNSIFANSNFLLEGLNSILEFNITK
jgi:type III pantothenate kinase